MYILKKKRWFKNKLRRRFNYVSIYLLPNLFELFCNPFKKGSDNELLFGKVGENCYEETPHRLCQNVALKRVACPFLVFM